MGGVQPSGRQPPSGRHPHPGQTSPRPDTPLADTPPADGHCCRGYASYWNAFLLHKTLSMNLWIWFQNTVADPGFSSGSADSQSGCANLLFLPKTAWKWKNLYPRCGGCPWRPLGSASEISVVKGIWSKDLFSCRPLCYGLADGNGGGDKGCKTLRKQFECRKPEWSSIRFSKLELTFQCAYNLPRWSPFHLIWILFLRHYNWSSQFPPSPYLTNLEIFNS